MVRLAQDEHFTVRDLLAQLAGSGGHRKIVGTPEQVAATIEHWFRSGAADGFNVMPDRFPEGLEAFTDHVVPLLRARGLFRHEYESRTLRGRLGIPVGPRARSGRDVVCSASTRRVGVGPGPAGGGRAAAAVPGETVTVSRLPR